MKIQEQEFEQALLGCIIMRPTIIKEITCQPLHFQDPRNRLIYEAMNNLQEDGQPIDYLTIADRIGDRSIIRYLTDLNDNVGTSANFKYYEEKIKESGSKAALHNISQMIGKMVRNGKPTMEIIEKIKEDIYELEAILVGRGKKIAAEVREWVATTKGHFLTTDCYRELGFATKNHKKAANMALLRLKEDGVIVECGGKTGCYRLIDKDSPEIEWLDADTSKVCDLKWPFQLETMVNIYPKNIIIVAGAPNAGKTAFLLNFVRLNLEAQKIHFLSSEMGPEELRLRIGKFPDFEPAFWKKFRPRERAANFADAIRPNAVNLIDYYEISENFYAIGSDLRHIHDRLKDGIAVIAMQKKIGADLGRGAEFTLEKPRLYLTMEPGELRIVKAKNWARPGFNPNNLKLKFKLINGCEFLEYE